MICVTGNLCALIVEHSNASASVRLDKIEAFAALLQRCAMDAPAKLTMTSTPSNQAVSMVLFCGLQ